MGSLLVHRRAGAGRRRIYLSGDTFTGKHLDEIRKRHPDSDTAVVHLGGTPYCSGTVTMDPNHGVDFLQRIEASSRGSGASRRLPRLRPSAVGIPFRHER
jgi:L-ascorbate metabolism protein UlaG (beta-lactamase superfamily)